MLDFVSQRQTLPQLARRPALPGKPGQVAQRQVGQHPALILAKRHTPFRQAQQQFGRQDRFGTGGGPACTPSVIRAFCGRSPPPGAAELPAEVTNAAPPSSADTDAAIAEAVARGAADVVGDGVLVDWAMRYGNPAIGDRLAAMKAMLESAPAYDKDPNGTGPFGLDRKSVV